MKPVLSRQPVFSGRSAVPRGWPPKTGSNVIYCFASAHMQ